MERQQDGGVVRLEPGSVAHHAPGRRRASARQEERIHQMELEYMARAEARALRRAARESVRRATVRRRVAIAVDVALFALVAWSFVSWVWGV